MEVLITYDVSTETASGRRRLRRVAKRCQAYGQRVQKSVFECTLRPKDLERLKGELKKEMDESQDSVRIYRLREPRAHYLEVLGLDVEYDLHGPIVV